MAALCRARRPAPAAPSLVSRLLMPRAARARACLRGDRRVIVAVDFLAIVPERPEEVNACNCPASPEVDS